MFCISVTCNVLLQVVLAMALSACSAASIYGLNQPFHPLTYSGLPAFHGLPAQTIPSYSGLPLTYSGLPATYTGLPTAYSGLPIHPTAYTTGSIVAPAPYTVHTGVRTEVAAEPVEQHGYVVKY